MRCGIKSQQQPDRVAAKINHSNSARNLKILSTTIDDSFAEAFSMRFTRLIITAVNQRWLQHAVTEMCGYGTSVIGCDAEVGLECWIDPADTLDGRPGASVLLFAFTVEALQQATFTRTGQCVMTCPTTAVFDGLPEQANAHSQH